MVCYGSHLHILDKVKVMPNYRRTDWAGGSFFFTLSLYDRRRAWLCEELARWALREAITTIRKNYPFTIDAWVLLPDHLHCLWTLPQGDSDYGTRWRLIKSYVTKHIGPQLRLNKPLTISRQQRQEGNLWQRRFWEHLIRDEEDFIRHVDYIHFNPVKHGLVTTVKEWPYSTFHRYVSAGIYSLEWGSDLKLDENHTNCGEPT